MSLAGKGYHGRGSGSRTGARQFVIAADIAADADMAAAPLPPTDAGPA
jgi:hypothetical protein